MESSSSQWVIAQLTSLMKIEKTIAYKLLVEGDHFGEIGVVYDCCRTATIVSRNYNTMANLSI